jgi:hypothetical protein
LNHTNEREKMTTTTLNRTELTEYETAILHEVKKHVRSHSIAVGAFVVRYGSEEALAEAGKLFLDLLKSLTADSGIRVEALEYGLASATWGANDQNASQAYQLRSEFLRLLYSSAIAEKTEA